MNIVAGSKRKTVLNSFLNETNFGKIQRAIDLNESGILAECRGKDFSSEMKFNFTPWKFTGTEVESQSALVLFTGNGFEGRTLLALMQGSSFAEKARAVFAYSACVTQAVRQNVELPANGAGGILYGENDGKIRLLFLPQNIFDFAARNTSEKDYALIQGVWQDKAFLSDNKADSSNPRALFFTRAVLIYSALSGEFPFPKENLEERQADILDANYLPLKNKVNGISDALSDLLSFDLERSSQTTEKGNVKEQGDESARGFCFDELSSELGLQKDGSVKEFHREAKISDNEFDARAKKILNKKNAQAKTKRIFRRNTALFVAGIILVVIAIGVRYSAHKNYMSRPTTISLTARESAEVFFSGMHDVDIIMMQSSSKGKKAQNFLDSVSNVHVASKMHSAYSQGEDLLTPEFWLYRNELQDSWQFGITNFMLGEDAASLSPADNRKVAPRPKENPVPQKEKNGAKKILAASFYRVHSEGPETKISAEKMYGNIEMTFVKNRWLVTDVDFLSEEENVSFEEFRVQDEAALEQSEGDAIAAAEILRKKYDWIPTSQAMHAARIEYETIAAKRARGELY